MCSSDNPAAINVVFEHVNSQFVDRLHPQNNNDTFLLYHHHHHHQCCYYTFSSSSRSATTRECNSAEKLDQFVTCFYTLKRLSFILSSGVECSLQFCVFLSRLYLHLSVTDRGRPVLYTTSIVSHVLLRQVINDE